jgi:hypothetical protein
MGQRVGKRCYSSLVATGRVETRAGRLNRYNISNSIYHALDWFSIAWRVIGRIALALVLSLPINGPRPVLRRGWRP